MKLSEFKKQLSSIKELNFAMPNSYFVPQHFHAIEVGQISKNFIGCGRTVRNKKVINFQLWEAKYFDHRLAPKRLSDIIALSEKILEIQNEEIEVQYQGETTRKYGLNFNGTHFLLTSKLTNCLATDKCGILTEKPNVNLSDLQNENKNACKPTGKCC